MFAPRATRSLVSLFTLGVVFLSLSLSPGGAMAATYVTDGIGIPPYAMHLEAFPNPFNSTTTIRIALPWAGDISLRLVGAQGRQVAAAHLARQKG
ncbi:MAG: hypothetical protein FJY67_03005 [Calditrichaeota bacterium]|nr:hypothetical protein [Calditrichota bacterium]